MRRLTLRARQRLVARVTATGTRNVLRTFERLVCTNYAAAAAHRAANEAEFARVQPIVSERRQMMGGE